MRERKGCCPDSSVPCDAPISSVSDSFGRFKLSTAPKENLRSLNLSTLRSSFVVESCPLRTASRLTAFPVMIFFHSESGNSGQAGELVSDLLVVLGSRGGLVCPPHNPYGLH